VGTVKRRYEKEEMQARVREAFKRLRDETQASSSAVDSRVRVDTTCEGKREREKGIRWLVIDAGKEMDVVSREMWGHVEPLVKNGGLEGPVGRLWSDRMV
jgi:dTMP kinase